MIRHYLAALHARLAAQIVEELAAGPVHLGNLEPATMPWLTRAAPRSLMLSYYLPEPPSAAGEHCSRGGVAGETGGGQ